MLSSRIFQFLIFASILFLAASPAMPADQSLLRFDGVYQTPFGGGTQSLYLRFYPDGYVVAMSYVGTPDEVAALISRSHSELPQAKYHLEGSKVIFTTKVERGEIDYEGRINGEDIAFHIHSRITDVSGDLKFVFRPVKFPAPEPAANG